LGSKRKKEKEFIDSLTNIFTEVGGETFYVELEASQKERLKRNRGEDRLLERPSKRNLEWSDANLRECDELYHLNTGNEEFFYKNYLKLDTQQRDPPKSAQEIFKFIQAPR